MTKKLFCQYCRKETLHKKGEKSIETELTPYYCKICDESIQQHPKGFFMTLTMTP